MAAELPRYSQGPSLAKWSLITACIFLSVYLIPSHSIEFLEFWFQSARPPTPRPPLPLDVHSDTLDYKIIVVPFGDAVFLGGGGCDDEDVSHRPDKRGRVVMPPAVAARLPRCQGVLDTPEPNRPLCFRRVSATSRPGRRRNCCHVYSPKPCFRRGPSCSS